MKLTEVDTYLGKLKVGDMVLLPWKSPKLIKVYAIYENIMGNISLGLTPESVSNSGVSYSFDGDILNPTSLLHIERKITDWRNEFEK